MKNIIRSSLSFLVVLISLQSCTKDSTDNNDPADPRSKFTGNWSVSETITKLTYEASIRVDAASTDGVIISNFGASGSEAVAYVSGDIITLPNQTLGSGWVVYGSGSITGSTKITWQYSINDGADLRQVIAIYTKI